MNKKKQPVRTFRDLAAWQRSMQLARQTYKATSLLSSDERFGLSMQMRRAAVSIPSNIAEGNARQGRRDYIRFLKTARGSLAELSTQYELATSMELMPSNVEMECLLAESDRILQSLIMSLERKKTTQPSNP